MCFCGGRLGVPAATTAASLLGSGWHGSHTMSMGLASGTGRAEVPAAVVVVGARALRTAGATLLTSGWAEGWAFALLACLKHDEHMLRLAGFLSRQEEDGREVPG